MSKYSVTAVVCDAEQRFTLEEVSLPEPGPGQVRLRTLWSGISFGTELALIQNRLSWGPYPLATGYMATGVVEAVGEGGTELAVGERAYCRNNAPLTRTDGTTISSVSGCHASAIVTRVGGTHGAARLPEGAPSDVASLFVLPAVGLHGVDLAQPEVGALVVVYGVGQVGLGVVAACALRGCTVVAVDTDLTRLAVAKALGADYLFSDSVSSQLKALAPSGADYVFECTGRPDCVLPATELCRPRGTFIWQGNYGAAPFPYHFLPAHGRQLTALFPCDDGQVPCRRWVMKGLASGTLAWEKTLTHRIPHTEAPAFFAAATRGELSGVVGASVHWSDET